jgi:photoactive yellow protein
MVDPSQMHAVGPNGGPVDLPVDLDALTAEQRDEFGVGILALDAAGIVLACNRAAGALCGLPPNTMIGRSFFRELVPSANVPSFYGRFLSGQRRSVADQAFEFVFGRIPAPPAGANRPAVRGERAHLADDHPPGADRRRPLARGRPRGDRPAQPGRAGRSEPVRA